MDEQRKTSPLVERWALCWLLACNCSAPQPELPELTIPPQLDARTRSLVDARLEMARKEPSNAERLGQLGLVFEAHALWQQARKCFDAAAKLDSLEPVWVYHSARASQHTGDFDGAFAAIQVVAERFPDFAPAQHHLGDMLLESGDLDGAEAAFRRAVASRQESPEGHIGLGRVALERRDYPAAVTALQHALSLAPGHTTASFLVGRAYRRLGRTEEADRAQAQGEGAKKYYIPDRTSRDLARYSGRNTPQRVTPAQVGGEMAQFIDDLVRYSHEYEERLDQSARHIAVGKPTEAIVILEEMRRERPRDSKVMNNLVVAYQLVNRFRDALAIIDEGLEMNPDAHALYISRSDCLTELKEYPQALAAADAAIEKGPQITQAHFARGRTLLLMEEFAEARVSLETAVGLDNSVAGVYGALAEACKRLGDDTGTRAAYAGARAALEAAVRLSPQDLKAVIDLGIVCVDLEDWPGAKRALDAARKLRPGHPQVKQLEQYYQQRKP